MQDNYVTKDEKFEEFLFDLERYVDNPSKCRKDEMPDFSGPFTEEEKKAFIDEYEKVVNGFNSVLPDEMKIDDNIEKFKAKVNNPKQAEIYRRTNFINKIIAQKEKLSNKYHEEMGLETNDKLPLQRNLSVLFRTDDTKEADEYNRNLLNYYYKYPYEVSQVVLKSVLNGNSSIYEAILKDDYERSKVYTDNFERCHFAFDSYHMLKEMEKDGKLISELSNAQVHDFLQIQQIIREGFSSTDMFAIPRVTGEQIGVLSNNIDNENIREYVLKVAKSGFDSISDELRTEVELAKKHGILDDETPALSFKAIEIKDGEEKEIKLTDALKRNDPNIKIIKRSEEEKENMLHISNGLKNRKIMRDFGKDFMTDYHFRSKNKDLHEFDTKALLDYNKGGFFERLFNTTSKEYKDFVNNFKKFTDPKNPDFSIKDKLYESAKAYMKHKNVENEGHIILLDNTGRERVRFCQAVIYAIEQNEELGKLNSVDKTNTVSNEINNEPERIKVIGLEKDVNIEKDDINKKVEKTTINKTKTVDVEKQV